MNIFLTHEYISQTSVTFKGHHKVSVLLKAYLNIVLRSLRRFVILYVPSMLANTFDKKYDDSPNNIYFMFGLVLKEG